MIQLDDLEMRFGDQVLFEKVSLQLQPGNRYGVVGANGAGKSTFLRLLEGDMDPYSGSLSYPKTSRLGVLEQDHFVFENDEILQTVISARKELCEVLNRQEMLLGKGELSDDESMELAHLEEDIARLDGYTAPSDAGSILTGLGIPVQRHNQTVSTLSGGYKLRVLLARLLFIKPEIMLLDEPTNHLDFYSIQWLENHLKNYQGTLLVVSHDHEFLNRVCSHMLDVDYQTIKLYTGNYSSFVKQKEQERELLEKQRKGQDKKRKELERFVERFKAKASKASQAASKQKQIDRLDNIEIPPSSRKAPSLAFKQVRKSGVSPLILENISYAYGEVKVLHKVSFDLQRGEKVALVGANGIGKSTLLKLITSELKLQTGRIEWGYESHFEYLPQDPTADFEKDQTIQDWLWEQDPGRTIGEIRSMLGRVLFSGEDADKKCIAISGGEASRLHFAKIMLRNHNLLILDEPTNHLDLETVEELVRALRAYDGSVILVSHNRYLVSKVANRIIELREDGLHDFSGGYEEFLRHVKESTDHLDRDQNLKSSSALKDTENKEARGDAKKEFARQKEIQKQTRKQKKVCEKLESRVEKLEKEQNDLMELLFDYEKFSQLDVDEQRKSMQKKDSLGHELSQVMEEWQAAMEVLEQLEAQE